MSFSFDTINGINVGIEYVAAADEYDKTVIIDLFLVRILIQWE